MKGEAVQKWHQLNIACSLSLLAAGFLLGSWYGRSPSSTRLAAAFASARRPIGRRLTAVPLQEERLFGPPLARMQYAEGAALFEPAAYRKYYWEQLFPTSDDALAAHYNGSGARDNRVAQRLRVVATYEAAAGRDPTILFGGLCNQIYTHVGMLAVLLQLGAEVVLPDAVHRGGHGYNDSFFDGQIQPIRAPLDSLFDVEHLVKWGKSVGAVLHPAAPETNNTISVVVPGQLISPYKQEPMDFIVGIIRTAVLGAVTNWLGANPGRDLTAPLPAVLLELRPPNLMLALRTDTSHTELIEEVSRNLRPAPPICKAAAAIVTQLTARGAAFNGVHLRVEADANFQTYVDGDENLMQLYVEMMKESSIRAPVPLYVASGLLTYMQPDEFQTLIAANLAGGGVCGPVLIKEQLLSPRQLEGLMSEALALIDLLVLVQAEQFAGWFLSSFSWVVQEYRCLRGVPTGSTTMVRPRGHNLMDYFLTAGMLSNHSRTCPA